MPNGNYEVAASQNGFETAVTKGTSVAVKQTVRTDFVLKLG